MGLLLPNFPSGVGRILRVPVLDHVEHDVHLADRAQMVGAVAPADVNVDVDLLGHDPAVHWDLF